MKESVYLFRGIMSDVRLKGDKNPSACSGITGICVCREAVNVSKRILPAYSSKFSKKKYKQYQLFVILLCKAWRNVSYRDVVEMISSNPAFIELLSLSETPHFTTIQKFSERTDKGLIGFVFNQVLKFFIESLGAG